MVTLIWFLWRREHEFSEAILSSACWFCIRWCVLILCLPFTFISWLDSIYATCVQWVLPCQQHFPPVPLSRCPGSCGLFVSLHRTYSRQDRQTHSLAPHPLCPHILGLYAMLWPWASAAAWRAVPVSAPVSPFSTPAPPTQPVLLTIQPWAYVNFLSHRCKSTLTHKWSYWLRWNKGSLTTSISPFDFRL